MNNSTKYYRLMDHIKRWKDTYEVLGVMSALLISTIALIQATNALQLQSREFRLRNRPYVILVAPKLAGPGVDIDRKTYPHTISFEIRNITEIPATQIKTIAEVYVNGTRAWGTVYPSTALTKEDPKVMRVFLSQALYDAVTNSTNRTRIICTTTYAGALGEASDAYRTETELEYYGEDKTVRPEKIEIK